MEEQKESRLRILAEAGSIEICSIHKGKHEGFDYFLQVSEEDLFGAGLKNESREMHESFYGAFDELNDKYPWHDLHLDFVGEDFAEYVADALVKRLNDPFEMVEDFQPENFERALGIKLTKRTLKTKTGFFDIQVKGLSRETTYHYREFHDEYAQEIGQKFNLESTVETITNYQGDSFDFTGTIEVSGNTVILKNSSLNISHILPSDKYYFFAEPEFQEEDKWSYSLV
ncbi:hypothetical protein [Kaistella palustris]|uniref:hypothetical protein n=1 Tax=Kaistella palustris TaxID=493376 RepID=UPI0003FD8F2B|nr:hypothetical protein [Kaistella palustris]